MKHKVGELDGALLDAAVAMVEGVKLVDRLLPSGGWREAYSSAGTFRDTYSPSTSWTLAEPIIERERIAVSPDIGYTDDNEPFFKHGWEAEYVTGETRHRYAYGATPLIAAMRCYVASKFGDEVELP